MIFGCPKTVVEKPPTLSSLSKVHTVARGVWHKPVSGMRVVSIAMATREVRRIMFGCNITANFRLNGGRHVRFNLQGDRSVRRRRDCAVRNQPPSASQRRYATDRQGPTRQQWRESI